MKPEWQFSDLNDYAYLKTSNGYASVTKINEFVWRWEAHNDEEVLVSKDSWWGLAATAEEAMFYAEKRL